MAAKCVPRRYLTKRGLSSIEVDISTTNDLRKRGKLEKKDDSSLRGRSKKKEVSRRV